MTSRLRRPLAQRLILNPLAVIAASYLLVLTLVAIIGPFVLSFDPSAVSISTVLSPPGGAHVLGTDSAGRDVASRLIVASALSLAGAAVAAIVAAAVGIPAGLLAGYRGGWFDTLASWVAGLLLSLPVIVVLLAARAVLGTSLWTIMVIFGVLVSPAYYRVVTGSVRAVRDELYIDAAKVAGLSDLRIVGRHVLSAVRAPAILLTSGVFAIGVAIQATLDFLGLGDRAVPTWGSMLSEGFYNLFRAPLLMLWPSVAIGLTCVAFALLGTALRDELEHAGDRAPKRAGSWAPPAAGPDAILRHDEGSTTAPLLTVDGLSVAYPSAHGWTTVVNDLSLSVGRGEVHALIGESGSGKTQTAWSILGLLPEPGTLVAGSVRFDGVELADGRDAVQGVRGRRIGYVPQEPTSNLDPAYTIGHQLVEPLRFVLGLDRRAARERALTLLRRVGIADAERVFSAHPHEISGGMAQRVLIAGAISCEPDLIIADEPTTALDVTVQAEILELLRGLQRDTGVSILLVTHNFGVVADLADRVSVMRQGSIVETGSVAEVFSRPKHPYTVELLAALLEGMPARAERQGPGHD